jgi:hypothetical protein
LTHLGALVFIGIGAITIAKVFFLREERSQQEG